MALWRSFCTALVLNPAPYLHVPEEKSILTLAARQSIHELDGTLVTFGYDAASQLILEQRSGAEAYNISYTYDPNKSRLTQSSSGAVTEYQYNAANEQILITPPTGAPTTQTFDAVGNLTLQNAGR